MNKYRAQKVTADGYTFDSKAEHKRYCELKLRIRAGEISQLDVHPSFVLAIGDKVIGKYTPDFQYYDKETFWHVEDVKGVITEAASLRMRLFQAIWGTKVEIIGKKPRKKPRKVRSDKARIKRAA